MSPWVQAVNNLQQAFTGPIARGLALMLAGIVFGLGMAPGAANFIAWLF